MIVPERGFRQMEGEPMFPKDDGAIVFGADSEGGFSNYISRAVPPV